MRVNEKSYAKRIKATLRDWDVVCDKEEAIDCVFYYFSRLHGIGVAVKETEISNVYTFMQYPNRTESIFHPLDTGYEESTCISTTMTVVKRQIEQTGADNIKYILKFVEKRLGLPHWEDYLEEKPKDKELTAKGFVELGKAIGEGMVAGLKHENPVTSDELKRQIKLLLNNIYGKPTKHDDQLDAMYYLASRGWGKSGWATEAALAYCKNDVIATRNLYNTLKPNELKITYDIDKVIFNDPATIVIWKDGSKTVVKAQDGETYEPEKGLAMAICKKTMGNTRDYYKVFLKYLKQWKKENPEKETVDVFDATGKQLVSFDFNPDEEVEVLAAFRQFADAHELKMWRHNDLLPYDYSYKFAQGDGENKKTYTILVNSICITRRELNDHLLAIAQYFHL